jgi:hypothetical protein
MRKRGLQAFDQGALTALKTRPEAGAHRDRRRRRKKGRATARRRAWELAGRLRELGVEAGDHPLRLSVAELARLLGDRGYGLVLEVRDGEGRLRLRFELDPEDPTLECMVGRGEWE